MASAEWAQAAEDKVIDLQTRSEALEQAMSNQESLQRQLYQELEACRQVVTTQGQELEARRQTMAVQEASHRQVHQELEELQSRKLVTKALLD